MNVLVVDDSRDNRELLLAMMQSQGHVVTQAENGLQALDMVRAEPPDLIISDILMPEMDGFTLCRILKASQSLCRIPFVLYSATYLSEEDMALGMAMGAARYLIKPMEPTLFIREINAVIKEGAVGLAPVSRALAIDDLSLAHAYQARISDKLHSKVRDLERLNHERAQILSAASEGIMRLDTEGRHTLVNEAAARLLGYAAEAMIGVESHGLWHHSYADGRPFPRELCPIHATLTQGDAHSDLTDLWWRKDGSAVLVEYSSTPLIEDGDILGVVLVFRDVTQRKLVESRLEMAASVFRHAREGIVITDAKGNIIEVNDAFTQVSGYCRAEVIGQNPRFLQSGRHGADFYTAMWSDISRVGHWNGEVWNRRKSGDVYVEMLSISAVPDATGAIQNYVALSTDITSLKAHQAELEHQANYDVLTGLPNRLLMVDRLRQALAQSQRRTKTVAVAYLDLDNFKVINDNCGHEVGDCMLIELAKRMSKTLREGDTLARIGGDEFVAIIVDLEQPQDAYLLIERLLEAASSPVELANSQEAEHSSHLQCLQLQVSASIGVTLYPQDDVDADVLLRHADVAMYAAKQDGRNRYRLFDLAQEAKVHSRHIRLVAFRGALDAAEFVLHYQPKVNLRSGQVIGVEALIRWQHADLGLLAPGSFLPDMENQPISLEVGEWVISHALEQMLLWQQGGLNLSVSVNVSAYQFQSADFVARLQALLRAHPGVAPGQLELEVLETSALENIAVMAAVMRSVQALGVHISLDDFGTGYSSLIYLRHLPAEVLKIDQSFVRDMLIDTGDLAIVKGVIGLAESFGRQVIAEGVESRAHSEVLLALGCEQAQGYGIARPMPAADVPGWVQGWRQNPLWTA